MIYCSFAIHRICVFCIMFSSFENICESKLRLLLLYQISASLTQIIRPKLYLRRDNARLPFNFWVLYCYESMNWVYRILHAMTCFCESRYIIIKLWVDEKKTNPLPIKQKLCGQCPVTIIIIFSFNAWKIYHGFLFVLLWDAAILNFIDI